MVAMMTRRARLAALFAGAALSGLTLAGAPPRAIAQTRVVDMVPAGRSGETNADVEPTLAVDPSDYSRMVGSAFTWDNLTMAPMTTALAPVYVTTDRGATWTLVPIVPSSVGAAVPTGDINPFISGQLSGAPLHSVGWLYTGVLSLATGGAPMVVLRTADYLDPATAMTPVDTETGSVDQPHSTVLTSFGADKVFVGFNNNYGCGAPSGKTATVDQSQSGAAATPTFNLDLVESRTSSCQDGAATVTAAHLDGTVYTALTHDFGGSPKMVVVRDDNYGAGAPPFSALTDPSDSAAGRFATGAFVIPSGIMGNNRMVAASNVSIAVDPLDSDRVYLAYGDAAGGTETIHVVRSINRGKDWSTDLLTVGNAMNPGIAINAFGTVGVFYQRLVSTNWESHLVRTTDADATVFDTPGLTLANTPIVPTTFPFNSALQMQLGDYASLRAAGKNFFGMFSTGNTPNTANFPNGVIYQRQVDWTTHKLYADAAHTVEVAASVDPYFFEVDALTPDQDFYVRDWTDDATHGDTGVEPSTHPEFYTTSDVWNQRSSTPLPFVNDQPTNEDAGNGAAAIGDNYAFVRVRRNAAGPAAMVTAHFLVAKFGTGSTWVDGSVGDPDLTFPADASITTDAGTGPWISPAFHWHLNAISGNHLCLAVEISAPGSPFIPPSLVGQTVGWGAAPFTDIRILSDNHKAQRNMHLSTTAATGGIGGSITDYAIIHNADVVARDIPIRIGVSGDSRRYVRGATVVVLGADKRPDTASAALGQTLVLRAVQPGESRWVALTVKTEGLPQGATAYITADEISGGAVVNGFAVGVTARPATEAVRRNLDVYIGVAERLALAFGAKASAADIDAARTLPAAAFADFTRKRLLPHLQADLTQAGALAGADGFGLQALLATAQAETSAPALTGDVASLLNGADARLTAIELSKGDPADIVQMVRWQKQLFRTRPDLAKLACASKVAEASGAFLALRDARKATNAEIYPKLLGDVSACLREAAAKRGAPPAGDFSGKDLAALERVHRAYLLALAN